MKQYLLSVIQPDGPVPAPDVLDEISRNLESLRRQMREAGAWVFAGGLHNASTATTLRPRDGEVLMSDGPFAEGKEHVGGLTIIRAPDLDAALEWGRKVALATTLAIEVRPFQDEPEG
jgi:hypothetical protein